MCHVHTLPGDVMT